MSFKTLSYCLAVVITLNAVCFSTSYLLVNSKSCDRDEPNITGVIVASLNIFFITICGINLVFNIGRLKED